MNNYKGKIISIGEVQELNNGAKKVSFQIETTGEYPKNVSFDLFKSQVKTEHLDKFLEYNKIGDAVIVEYIAESREYNGKWYTNLSMWSCKKQESTFNGTEEPTAAQMGDDTQGDGLPF